MCVDQFTNSIYYLNMVRQNYKRVTVNNGYLTLIRLRSRVRCFHFTAITVTALVPQIKQLTHDNAQTWLLVHLEILLMQF